MDLVSNLAIGFGVAATPINLVCCFIGCLLGTLIGVLPGVGPVATIAMLLPATYALPPVSALIMLAGIYYGAQYGGSTTSILVNMPGETSSVVTCLDGHPMARMGQAARAFGAQVPFLMPPELCGDMVSSHTPCQRLADWLGEQGRPANALLCLQIGRAHV